MGERERWIWGGRGSERLGEGEVEMGERGRCRLGERRWRWGERGREMGGEREVEMGGEGQVRREGGRDGGREGGTG